MIVLNLAFIGLLGLRSWTGRGEATPVAPVLPSLAQAPRFDFTDSAGLNRTLASLQGRPWLVNFIYTRCPSQCPRMNQRLQSLSHELPADLGFLTVTCDPDHDTPDVLRAYSEEVRIPGRTWIFASADAKSVGDLADALLIGRSEKPELHSLRWVLIDGDGAVRGHYDSQDPEHLRRLVRDSGSLA